MISSVWSHEGIIQLCGSKQRLSFYTYQEILMFCDNFFASAKYNIFYFDSTLYDYFQDINGVSQALAAELFEKGDLILASQDVCEMTPMQLFAITERLKLPLPTCGEFLQTISFL